MKTTQADRKIMLPVRNRMLPTLTLAAIKKPAQTIKAIQPQRLNFAVRVLSSLGIAYASHNLEIMKRLTYILNMRFKSWSWETT